MHTRSHHIVDTMSQQFIDSSRPISGTVNIMIKTLPPRVRAMIINYHPTQPEVLSISEFCKTQKSSCGILNCLRRRTLNEVSRCASPALQDPNIACQEKLSASNQRAGQNPPTTQNGRMALRSQDHQLGSHNQ